MDARGAEGAGLDTSGADERYRRLIDQSGVGLFHTDTSGNVRWVNDAAAAIVGYDSSEEFVSAIDDIRQIYVDPDRRDEFQRVVERDHFVSGFEYEIYRKDGSRRWLSVSATVVRSADGSIEGYEGTVLDVTPRKLLESATAAMSSRLEPHEAVARFVDVLRHAVPFDQLTLAVIEDDHYRRLVSISLSNRGEFFPTGELVPLRGNSMEAVVGEARPVIVHDTQAGEWDFDRRLHEAGIGSYVTLPLIDERGVFATFNVGKREKGFFTEESVNLLLNHCGAVAHAVKNIILYEQQAAVVERLTELDRLKSQFFASISHDLRSPVAVVVGVVEVLRNRWNDMTEDRKLQMIDAIAGSAANLQRMTERDLQVALLQSGELTYEVTEFDLPRFAKEVVATFAESVPDRRIDVSSEDDLPLVRGDVHRHIQILQNLLSNAVKFSEVGSRIDVSVTGADQELMVCVADEGVGMDARQMDSLFEWLARGPGSQPGTGLGLYIAKSMVEAQGGRIWAESEPGHGSRFFYTAPITGSG